MRLWPWLFWITTVLRVPLSMRRCGRRITHLRESQQHLSLFCILLYAQPLSSTNEHPVVNAVAATVAMQSAIICLSCAPDSGLLSVLKPLVWCCGRQLRTGALRPSRAPLRRRPRCHSPASLCSSQGYRSRGYGAGHSGSCLLPVRRASRVQARSFGKDLGACPPSCLLPMHGDGVQA